MKAPRKEEDILDWKKPSQANTNSLVGKPLGLPLGREAVTLHGASWGPACKMEEMSLPRAQTREYTIFS